MNWFLSSTVRHACAMRSHVQKILNHQRDILAPKAVSEVESAMREMKNAVASNADKAALQKQMEKLEQTAGKWLKPYPNAAWRENVEVLLVALAVAMGIRTFFLQPFKIPTGSMQPTLFGVKSKNQINQPDFKIPGVARRLADWVHGISYVHLVAKNDGELEDVTRPWPPAIFSLFEGVKIGGSWQIIWLPPDFGEQPLQNRANLEKGRFYHKGDEVVKLEVHAGDHLFVDRVTYNFSPPERGQIVVFETHGITRLPPDQQDTFYIKRLVGLGGETLSIHQDYQMLGVPQFGTVPVGNLVVDGRPLSASTPHFENLYSFSGASPRAGDLQYKEDQYYGHAMIWGLAPGNEFQVETNHYFVMGDKTMNSSDSRYWGDFPQRQVIGKSFFVYWPITSRFGWGNR